MRGAIFYSSKYGSTEQYARWISKATGLPMFHVKDSYTHPRYFDFFILGSPIIYYKLSIHKWVKRHMAAIRNKPVIFFSVSGAPAGEKLDGWIANSLPDHFISRMNHVALRGRQVPSELTLYDRMMLRIAAMFNKDPQAREEELKGFDYMDKSTIEPIVNMVHQFQSSEILH